MFTNNRRQHGRARFLLFMVRPIACGPHICHVTATPDGKPCLACTELLKHDVHQLARKAARATGRIERGAVQGIVSALRQVGAGELGHLELVAHLEATLVELQQCQNHNAQLATEVERLAVQMLESQEGLHAQADLQPGGVELLALYEKAYTGKDCGCDQGGYECTRLSGSTACMTRLVTIPIHSWFQIAYRDNHLTETTMALCLTLLQLSMLTPMAVETVSDFKLAGSALEQLLLGIAKGVHMPRRCFSAAETAFYTTLLNLGGPLVLKYVSDNLNGPCLRTVWGACAGSAYFRLDCLDENVQQVRILGFHFIVTS